MHFPFRGSLMPPIGARLRHESVPADVKHALALREAAVWVTAGFDDNAASLNTLAQFLVMPWALGVLETSRGQTARVIQQAADTADRFARVRGLVHLIAEDPGPLGRIGRSLPIYMLNGRD